MARSIPHRALFILLLLSPIYLVTPLSVTIIPYGHVLVRPLGENVVFTCSSRGQVADKEIDVVWIDTSGRRIPPASRLAGKARRLYSERTTTDHLQLHIKSLQEDDVGVYTCQVTQDGRYYRRSVTLQAFKDIEYEECPESQTLLRGREGFIKCTATASPTPIVSWTFKGRIIITDERNELTKEGLKIYDVKDEDTGNYICMATLPSIGLIRTQKIAVRVIDPPTEAVRAPEVLRVQLNTSGSSQETVAMTCVVTGQPAPDIEWFKLEKGNYQIVKEESWLAVKQIQDGEITIGVLEFRDSRVEDEGSYLCSAVNTGGSSRQSFNWSRAGDLDGDASPPNIDRIHMNRTQASADDVMVTCVASGSPVPSLQWFRRDPAGGNQLISPGGRSQVEQVDTGADAVLTLVIPAATTEDEGVYFCSAANRMGSVRQQFELSMSDSHPENMTVPHISLVHVNKTGDGGKDLTISCVAQGVPSPQISFRRQTPAGIYQLLLPSERLGAVQAEGRDQTTVAITWSSTTSADAGAYQCVATNMAGSVSQNFHVNSKGDEGLSELGHASQQRGSQWYYQSQSSQDLPGPPSLVQVTTDPSNNVVLKIARPHKTTGITQYRIKYSIGGYNWKEKTVDFDEDSGYFTDVPLDNLLPSTTYEIRVSSVSSVGESRASILSYTTAQSAATSQGQLGTSEDLAWLRGKKKVPQAVPFRLTVEGVENNVRAVWLSWDWVVYATPADYVQGFQVVYTSTPDSPESSWQTVEVMGDTSRSYIVQGLDAGEEYSFIVRGRNNFGLGPNSERIIYRVPLVPEIPPRDFVVENIRGNPRDVRFRWTPLDRESAGADVTEYRIYYTTSSDTPLSEWRRQSVHGTDQQYTLSELEPATTYFFRIQARNADGGSPVSSYIVYRTPSVRISDGPSYVDISTDSATQVSLRISRPANSGGYPIDAYVIDYEPAQGRQRPIRKVYETEDSYFVNVNVPNLSPSTEYVLRVSARTRMGYSEPTELRFTTPRQRSRDTQSQTSLAEDTKWLKKTTGGQSSALLTPRDLTTDYSAETGTVTLSWKRPLLPTIRVKGYSVLWSSDLPNAKALVLNVPGSQTTAEIRDLQPNTVYRFQVRAEAKGGRQSTYTKAVTVKTPALPDPPSELSITSGDAASFSIRVSRPRDLMGNPLLGYRIRYFAADEEGFRTYEEIIDLARRISGRIRLVQVPCHKESYMYSSNENDSVFEITHGHSYTKDGKIDSTLQDWVVFVGGVASLTAWNHDQRHSTGTKPSSDAVYTPVKVKGLSPGVKYKFEVASQTKDGFSAPRTIEFTTPKRFQYHGEVAVEQETGGPQQPQVEELDLDWLKEVHRQQSQKQVTSKPPATPRPAGDEPTTSYTLSWDEYKDNLAGLVKYIVIYREVDVDPITEEIVDVISEDWSYDVEPSVHTLRLDNLIRGHYYQIEVTAISRVGQSVLRYVIKKFVYWVPPATITPPHIAHIHQNKTGPDGADVMMTCEATGSPPPRLSWLRKQEGQLNSVQTGERFVIKERISRKKAVISLRIQEVSSDDYGTYVCSAVSPAGNSSHEFHFMTDVPVVDPQPPHVYRIHVNRTGHTGADIMVTCKASGRPPPEMKWQRNQQSLYPGEDDRIIIDTFSGEDEGLLTLLIKYPVSGDAGTYHCVAKNAFGSTKQKFSIETEYSPENLVPPHVSRIHVNRTGEGEKDVLMMCLATGSPPPEIRWSRQNDQGEFDIVWPGDRHVITQTEDVDFTENRMIIRQVTEKDYGTYRCTAGNFADSVDQNVDLSFVRPENLVAPQLTRLFVSQLVDDDNDISIICTAEGNPAPEMSLLRKNSKGIYKFVFPDDRMTIEQDKGRKVTTFSLTIDEPSASDTGSYACSAVNLGGRVQQPFLLNTQEYPLTDLVSPLVVRINSQRPESEGGDVSLTCAASGTPAPDVTWRTEGQPVTTSDKYAVKQTEGIGETVTKLTIRKGSIKDARAFTCVAKNIVGEDTKDYQLTIQDVLSAESIHSPHIERVHLNSTGPGGAGATLTCIANGFPIPIVALLRQTGPGSFDKLTSTDTLIVKEHQDGEDSIVQLVIPQATEKYAGLYRCSAENLAGAVSQDVNVDLPVKILENAQLPHISRIHINRTGHDRADVTVTCIARGYPAPEMKWLRFDELVLPRGRFSIQQSKGDNQTVISLTILQAVDEDEGSYRCSAVNIAGSVAQLFDLGLRDTIATEPPHISRIHVNWTGLASDDIQVTCVANGRPEMSFWQKSGGDYEIIFPGGNIDIMDEKTDDRTVLMMTFHRPTPEQAGAYRCLARNPAGEVQQPFTVHTEVLPIPADASPPHVSRVHVNRTGEGDRDVSVTCRVEGVPAPATNWLRRDKTGQFAFVWSSERYAIFEYRDSTGTTLTLTISEATSADDALFLCSASNIVGDVQQPFSLTVFEEPPQNAKPPTVQWVHVSRAGPDDEDVVISCTGVGEPAPEVGIWRRNQEHGEDYLVQVGGRVAVNYTKGAGQTKINLSFLKAEESDEGTYVCSAANIMGSVKQAFQLHVKDTLTDTREPPHISRIHINTTESGDLMVVCVASGIPRPLMDWLRPNEEGVPKSMQIKNYHVVEVSQEGNKKTFTLFIQQPTTADEGDYYCSARSLAGRVIQKFTIGAHEIPEENLRAPHIAHLHMNMTGERAEDMMLTCVVTGTPAPLLSFWINRGAGRFKRIWPSRRRQMEGFETADGYTLTMVIPKATLEDDGLYRCSAVSVAGSTGQVAKVQLPGPPPKHLVVPIIEHVHINKTSPPGEHLMVTCQAKGSPAPEMRWLRKQEDGTFRNVGAHAEDVTIEDFKGDERTVLTLVVQNADAGYWDGAYRCHAVNYAGKTDQDFDLALAEPPPADSVSPFIDRIHVNNTGSNQDDIMITCRATGVPSPAMNLLLKDDQGEYYYMKPSKAEDAIVLEQDDATVFALILRNPRNSGRGSYRCQAANIAGVVREDFDYNTQVLGGQEERAPHVNRIHVDRAGESSEHVTVLCKASGVPAPHMNWWKYTGDEFQLVWPDDRTIIEQQKSNNNTVITLLLKNANSNDDGQYQCSAVNYVGDSEQPFDFKVFESPPKDLTSAHISRLHANRTGPYETGMQITCLATGKPSPEMRWYKQSDSGLNRLVLPSDDIVIEQLKEDDDTQLTLEIANPQDSDSGVYVCEATNVGGTSSYEVRTYLSEEPVKDKVSPHITRIHVNRTGEKGEDISIFCQATGLPAPLIKWMKNMAPPGRPIDYRYIWPVGRVDVTEERLPNQTTVYLHIRAAEEEDAGNYLCLAGNIAGDTQQDFDVYTSYETPENAEIPHIEWIHTNRTGLNNNDISVTCVARGVPPPEVWFYRGDPALGTELITPSERTGFYQIQGSTKTALKLTLRNAKDEDAGPYLCKATNAAGYRSFPFEVVVTEPEIPNQRLPQVSHIRVRRVGVSNQNVLLTCEAEGNPAPELNWWKNEGTEETPQFRLLWPGDEYEIHQSQDVEKTILNLTIKNVDETSLDTYLCSAANIGGQVRQRFELTALPSTTEDEDEPRVERLVVTRSEESELKLTCSAEGLPPPQLQVYKLDDTGAYQLLKPQEGVRFFETNGVDSTNLQVTIQQATEKDGGSYMCSAANHLGAAREVADYALQDAPYDDEVPPHINRIHVNRTGEDGADVMVTCLALGTPAPTVTWWKDYSERGGQQYKHLPPVGSHRIRQEKQSDHTVATLVLPQATRREEGWYQCGATNPSGEVKQEFEVVVQADLPRSVPPHVGRINVNKTGENRKDLTLTCVSSGEPAPGMNFHKQIDDGNFYLVLPASADDISERRGVGETTLQLTIRDFTLEDFGLYRCAAANIGGRVSQTFNVQIDDTPQADQQKPYINRVFVDRSTEDRRDVTLTCVANGVPAPEMRWRQRDLLGAEMSWPSDRFDVEQLKFEDYSVLVLTIRGATYSDDGTYICEAANILERVEQPFSLRVFADPPKRLVAPKVGTVFVNQSSVDVNIYCEAIGQPAPDLYLSKLDPSGNYVALKPSASMEFTQDKKADRTLLQLKVKDASATNAGDYICTASSLTGTSRRKFDFSVKAIVPVEVKGRPSIQRILVEEPNADSKVLVIKCFGQGDPLPNMMLFRRDPKSGLDQQIKAVGRYKVRETQLPGSVLLEVNITKARPRDTGIYICRAVNDKGTYRTKFNLTVEEYTVSRKGAPEFIEPRVERTGNNGEDVQVTCRARGDPAPDMLFLRQQVDGPETTYKAITTDGRHIVEEKKGEVDTTLHVTIRQAGAADAGTYVCSARNSKGSSRQQFKLSIQDSDVLPGKPGNVRTRSNQHSILIGWTPPADSSTDVTGYRVGYGLEFPDIFLNDVPADRLSFVINNLTPGKEYILTVWAVNAKGQSAPVYVTETTKLAATERARGQLKPVVGLRANVLSPWSISLSWRDVAGEASDRRDVAGEASDRLYTVRYARRTGEPGGYEYVNTSQTSVTITDLQPGQVYEFSVRPVQNGSVGPWSAPDRMWTLTIQSETEPPADFPNPVVGLIAEALSPGNISLSWRDVAADDEAHRIYTVRYSSLNEEPPEYHYVYTHQTSVTITDLRPGQAYQFSVRLEGKGRSGPWSMAAQTKTSPIQPETEPHIDLPDPVVGLIAEARSPWNISLSWRDVTAGDEADRLYTVRYARRTGEPGGYEYVNTSQTSVTITDLQPGQVYEFSVRPVQNGSVGPWSAPDRMWTLTIQSDTEPRTDVPDPVMGLIAEALSPWNISLSWRDVAADDEADRLYTVRYARRTGEPGGYEYVNTSQTSVTITDLQPGQVYEFSVRPVQNGSVGPWSMSTQTKTLYNRSETVIPVDSGQVVDGGQEQEGLVAPQAGRPRFGGVQVLRSGAHDADVTITCQSDGQPAPTMEFYREDEPGQFTQVQSGGRYLLYPTRREGGSSLQIIIRQATVEDTGNYRCTASNLNGQIQQQFTLTIEEGQEQQGQEASVEDQEWLLQQRQRLNQVTGTTVPPIVPASVPELLDVQVQRSGPTGSDVTVICQARGQPAPDLDVQRYIRDQYRSIRTSGKFRVNKETTADGSRLILVVSNPDEATFDRAYLCTARNQYGSANKQFRLNRVGAGVRPEQPGAPVGSVPPRFDDVKVDRTGINKANVVVTCRVSGSPAPNINLWREVTVEGQADYKRIRTGGRYVVDLQRHTGYSLLTAEILSATSDDAGTYLCSADSSAGSNRQQFSLTIEDPRSVEEEGAPNFKDVKVGRTGTNQADVVVTCKVRGSPAPDVSLWRETPQGETASFQGIQTGGRYVVSQNKYGDETVLRVVISQATSADAGTYYCSAQNPKGSFRQQFSITIDAEPSHPEGYPKFEDVQVDRTGVNRADVVVTCKVSGSPAPRVSLWREVEGPDGIRYQGIRTGGRFSVQENPYRDNTILRAVIRSASSADAGTYLCSAQNSVGADRQKFSLTIGGETIQQTEQHSGQNQVQEIAPSRPEGYPKFEDVQVDRTGVDRANVVVTCKVTGSPAPNINLWREVAVDGETDYKPVRTGGRVSVSQRKYGTYTLLRTVINGASSADAGTYLCAADNKHGSLRQQFKLTIGEVEGQTEGLPDIGDIVVERTGSAQKDVLIRCTATGSPLPRLKLWRKQKSGSDYDAVEESGRVVIRSGQSAGHGYVSVIIRQVTESDAGTYLCTAINAKGTVKQEFNLTVQVGSSADGLRIAGVTVDSTGENNQDVTITCTGHGSPAPTMRLWRYKDGRYRVVVRSSRIIMSQQRGEKETVFEATIKKTTQDDAGVYICAASNANGTVRQQFNLTIEEYAVSGKNLPVMKGVTVERTGSADENAIITCSVTGSPPPDVKLYKKIEGGKENEYQLIQSGGRLVLNEAPDNGGTVLTLLVKTAGPEDSGLYMCEASNTGGTVRQSFRWGFEAAQSDSPDLPQITSLTVDPLSPETGHVTLRCVVSSVSEHEMKWWKLASRQLIAAEYEILFPGDRLQITQKTEDINTTLVLTIQDARPSDAGKYLCTAQNSNGSDQKTLDLQLEGDGDSELPPVIVRISDDSSLMEGGRLDLTCEAKGNPYPEMKWWRYEPAKDNAGFKLIWPDDRYMLSKKVSGDKVMSFLVIQNVRSTDSGMYLCTAINKYGSVRTNITIQVKRSEDIVNPRIVKHPKDLLVDEDEPATLVCLAEGEPSPSITWYKDGQPLTTLQNKPSPHIAQLTSGRLHFIKVTRDHSDEGVYHCVATNSYGSVSSREARLEIKVKHESISATPQIIQIENIPSEEYDVVLECVATGIPSPDMKWWKVEKRTGATQYHQLASGDSMAIDEVRGTKQSSLLLKLVDMSAGDAGKYLCIASNKFGRRRQTFDLVLEDTMDRPTKTTTPKQVSTDEVLFTAPVTPPTSTEQAGAIPGRLAEITRVVKVELDSGGVRLVCEAIGYPTPELSWWLYDTSGPSPIYRLIKSGGGQELSLQYIDGTSRLTFTMAWPRAEDMGTYQCTANNYIGQSRKTLHLTDSDDRSAQTPNPTSTTTTTITTTLSTPVTMTTNTADFSIADCQSGTNIQIGPRTSELRAKLGDGMVLTCDYLGYAYKPGFDPSLVWYSPDGNPVRDTNTSSRVYAMAEGPLRALIFIRDVRDRDGGDWTCLSVVDGQKRCGQVSLLVWEDITFSDLPRSVNGLSGQDVLLTCHLDGTPLPNLSWSRNGRQLTRDDPYIQTHRGLLIHELKKEDAGKYLCEARVASTGRYESRVVSLYVDGSLPEDTEVPDQRVDISQRGELDEVPCPENRRIRVPILSLLPSTPNLRIYAGQGVVLTCQARALSVCDSVRLAWRDPASRLVQDSHTSHRKHVRKSDGSLELVLREVRPQDSGKWTCSGATANTEVSKSFNLYVLEDINLSPTSKRKYSVPLQADAELGCDVRGSPRPVVSWSRAGVPITSDDHYVEMFAGLRVQNVTTEDAGVYSCKAYVPTTGRFRSWDIELDVIAPPLVTIEISNRRVGSFSALICTGKGSPTPDLQWYKGDTPITQEDDRIKLEGLAELKKSTKSLIFIPLELQDEGNYTCRASNEAGQTEHTFILQPLSRPGLPGPVKVVHVSPSSVTLAISPSEEENRSPVLDYHVAYISMQNFEQTRKTVEANDGEDVLVELLDLTPLTTYRVRIYARNIVDFGSFKELYVTTSE